MRYSDVTKFDEVKTLYKKTKYENQIITSIFLTPNKIAI